jgi:hypothetical protein
MMCKKTTTTGGAVMPFNDTRVNADSIKVGLLVNKIFDNYKFLIMRRFFHKSV